MEPLVAGTASPGNVGRDFVAIRADVTSRILSTVRQRFPQALLVNGRPLNHRATLAGYEFATGEAVVAREEIIAAEQALERGATHLLVPTITEWRQMRTDDPIGALTTPHNSVTLTLRLMRLQPPALAGRVAFQNRARLTLNQPPIRLLNERFRQVILRLVSGI